MVLFYLTVHLVLRGTFPHMFTFVILLLYERYFLQEDMIVVYHVYCKYLPNLCFVILWCLKTQNTPTKLEVQTFQCYYLNARFFFKSGNI